MSHSSNRKASLLAADLIEEQLSVLTLSIPAVSHSFENGGVDKGHFERIVHPKKLRLVKTASGGNIVAEKAEFSEKAPTETFSGHAETPTQGMHDCLRVMVGNCLVTVGMFMQQHNMLDMRTPEFQFLGRIVDATLNANTFNISQGYMLTASFDGLVVDSNLHGSPLFSEGTLTGFMEYGDALALLQWLLRYLRGEHSYVSGGDAG